MIVGLPSAAPKKDKIPSDLQELAWPYAAPARTAVVKSEPSMLKVGGRWSVREGGRQDAKIGGGDRSGVEWSGGSERWVVVTEQGGGRGVGTPRRSDRAGRAGLTRAGGGNTELACAQRVGNGPGRPGIASAVLDGGHRHPTRIRGSRGPSRRWLLGKRKRCYIC